MDYKIISADSHLEIPIDRWVDRVPDEHRERAPRGIRLANGGDAWLIEGRPLWAVGLELSGRPFEEFQPTGLSYEGAAGAGPPEQRVTEMDRDGVDAEVLFPGVGGANFWRGIALDDAYLAVIHAYNEYLVEEYSPVDPQRLLALGLIPETGIDEALDELRYCARGGLKGVCLNGWPCGRSYPAQEDDVFWREAMDLGIAVTVHIQLRYGAAGAGPAYPYPKAPPPDVHPQASDPLRHIAAFDRRGGLNALQLAFAGTFDRLPDFRIYFAETYIGWLPIFFEQADMLYERTIGWANDYVGLPRLDRLPSEYLRNFIYWGSSTIPSESRSATRLVSIGPCGRATSPTASPPGPTRAPPSTRCSTAFRPARPPGWSATTRSTSSASGLRDGGGACHLPSRSRGARIKII